MKKWISISLIVVAVIGLTATKFVPVIALNMITDYKPYTFEKVLNNPELQRDYGIDNTRTPQDYGYDFKEIDFKSIDGTKLNGWYVNSPKQSRKCIAFIHGRTSNRLKTMKYLALVDSLSLDADYNIFIPDLRNSGKSEGSKTLMGYKFGEDVTAAILMLNDQLNQDTILLYGFSMGAMAIGNTLGRPELKSRINTNNITIEKIILDSPLSNVKETLRDQTSVVPFSQLFYPKIFELYSEQIHGYGEKMRLSKLLPDDIPVLILQSNSDQLTLSKNLELELKEMQHYNRLKVVFFEGPGHVKIFQDEITKDKYIQAVGDFMNNSKSSG